MLSPAFIVVLAAVFVQISDAKVIGQERVDELTHDLVKREIEDKSSNDKDIKKGYGYIKFDSVKSKVKKDGYIKTVVFLIKRYFLHLTSFIAESFLTPIQILWASKYKIFKD